MSKPSKPKVPNSEAVTPIRSFRLNKASIAIIEKMSEHFSNQSAVVNTALREFGHIHRLYEQLGIEPPEDLSTLPTSTPLSVPNPLESLMRIEILPVQTRIALPNVVVPLIHHDGQIFAETPTSGEYWIRLHNTSGERVEAVLSVDGINAVDGKDASGTQRGWVLEPYQTADIKGWYRTSSEVAAFTFATAGSGAGYAEKTGRGTDNVGVIGVAVFKEKSKPMFWSTIPTMGIGNFNTATKGILRGTSTTYTSQVTTASASMDVQCSVNSGPTMDSYQIPVQELNYSTPVQQADVSTAYGRAVEMHSGSTTFDRASVTPFEVIAIRYASRDVLTSWGVPVTRKAPPRPNPFPQGFGVPAPTGWTGR